MMAGSQDVESAPGFRRGFLKGQRDLQEKHGQHFLKITDPSHADQTRRGFQPLQGRSLSVREGRVSGKKSSAIHICEAEGIFL